MNARNVWAAWMFCCTLFAISTLARADSSLPPPGVFGLSSDGATRVAMGSVTERLSIQLPPDRGEAAPELSLIYGAGQLREAGLGWGLSLPSIQRAPLSGAPTYADPVPGKAMTPLGREASHICKRWGRVGRSDIECKEWGEKVEARAPMDRFAFGGRALVPVCTVGRSPCPPREAMPDWSRDWHAFRLQRDDYTRLFWSPDRATWRVLYPSGLTEEYGSPRVAPAAGPAFGDTDSAAEHAPFRWNLVRRYDTRRDGVGRPVNVTVYHWKEQSDVGLHFLTDIYFTPSVLSGTDVITDYAHHVALTWASNNEAAPSHARIWRARPDRHLERIDVTSKTFLASGERELVRRYRASYTRVGAHPFLEKFWMEGRCPEPLHEVTQRVECYSSTWCGGNDTVQSVVDQGCPALPPVVLSYTPDLGPAEVDPLSNRRPGNNVAWTGSRFLDHNQNPTNLVAIDANSDGRVDLVDVVPSPEDEDSSDPGPSSQTLFLNGITKFDKTVLWVPDAQDRFPLLKPARELLSSSQGTSLLGPWSPFGEASVIFAPRSPDFSTSARLFSIQQKDGKWTWVPGDRWGFGSFADHQVGDINGDGFPDLRATIGDSSYITFAERAPNGSLVSRSVSANLPEKGQSFISTLIADMDGDGLGDLVGVGGAGIVRYFPGDGSGRFGCTKGDHCQSDGFVQMGAGPTTFFEVGGNVVRSSFVDLNQDGFADAVEEWRGAVFDGRDYLGTKGYEIYVFLNLGGTKWSVPFRLKNPAADREEPNADKLLFGDINGNGTTDVLAVTRQGLVFFDVFDQTQMQTPSGMLRLVDNSLGAQTEYIYQHTTRLAADATEAWTTRTPRPSYVVTRVNTPDKITTFEYHNPIYDGWTRALRGFSKVRTRLIHSPYEPTRLIETHYRKGPCQGLPVSGACKASELDDDATSEGRLAGLPFRQDISDGAKTFLSTTFWTHVVRGNEPIEGMDRRHALSVYEQRTDTYLYDTSFQNGSQTSTVTVNDAVSYQECKPGIVPICGTVFKTIPRQETIASNQGSAHLVTTRNVEELTGLERVFTDMGRVGENDKPIDDPIVRITTWNPELLRKGIARPESVKIPPFKHKDGIPDGQPHVISYKYDAFGGATDVFATLTGSLPLDRRHEQGASPSPQAPNAASDGTLNVVHKTFDDYGNATRVETPDGGCVQTDYDKPYAALAKTVTVYTQGCGQGPIVQRQRWDRGLGVVTLITNEATGQIHITNYDAFGRFSESYAPDVMTPLLPSAEPTRTVHYELGAPFSRVHTVWKNGSEIAREAWEILDGLGRRYASLSSAENDGTWIAQGTPQRNVDGALASEPEPTRYDGKPEDFLLRMPSTRDRWRHEFDAFGRVVSKYGREYHLREQLTYHALSVEVRDQEQVHGKHKGAVSTVFREGHGRIEQVLERRRINGKFSKVDTRTFYQATGEVAAVVESNFDSPNVIKRWMQHDSLGRMVLNAEPHSTENFAVDPAHANGMRAWRYAYDAAGRLVGTSDARGCGVNFFYDAVGRDVAEDVVPCLASQPAYTPPNLQTGDGTEAFYHYDKAGRRTDTWDRAAHTHVDRDLRGRIARTTRRLALPGEPKALLASRYAPHEYVVTADFDQADRLVRASTGADVSDLLAADPQLPNHDLASNVWTTYSRRDTVDTVTSSYGELLRKQVLDPDGLVSQFELGDVTHVRATLGYDNTRRLQNVKIDRADAPANWAASNPDFTRPLVLENATLGYDLADHITSITDGRTPSEWPQGAKPIDRTFELDDAYRVTKVTYKAASGDTFASPFAHEIQSGKRGIVPPHELTERPKEQSFSYDWRGNTTRVDDDAHAFFERSLAGRVQNGGAGVPDQLMAAGPVLDNAQAQEGVHATYDAAGAMTSLTVLRKTCADPTGKCNHLFVYTWNEKGELARARRWDANVPGALSQSVSPDVDLGFAYDASGARVLKTVQSPESPEALYSADIFPSLRLSNATWDDAAGDYERTASTEHVYLGGLAHVAYLEHDVRGAQSGRRRVFFLVGDHLGSTSTVIDQESGELVERATYQAYGAPESDFRPDKWGSFREEYRFTGKAEDLEVGLVYFGARYYNAQLGRWISADPLTVHAGGADSNAYAYVRGRVMSNIDPFGLYDALSPPPGGVEIDHSAYGIVWKMPETSGVSYEFGENIVAPRMGGNNVEPAVRPTRDQLFAAKKTQDLLADTLAKQIVSPLSNLYVIEARFLGQNEEQVNEAASWGMALWESVIPATLVPRIPEPETVWRPAAPPSPRVTPGSIASVAEARLAPAAEGICFTEGTPVLLCDGAMTSIEHLQTDDKVLSRNEQTGALECRAVVRTFRRTAEDVVTLVWSSAEGHSKEEIHVTREHPFWIEGKGWVPTRALVAGDRAFSATGKSYLVVAQQPEQISRQVFNVEVEFNHSYFVGSAQLLAHNACEAEVEALDWSIVPAKGKYAGQTRIDHVGLHNVDNALKPSHGVFFGDGVTLTSEAWGHAQVLGLKPDVAGSLTVPMGRPVGVLGGVAGSEAYVPLSSITIKLVPGTNRLITAFPDL